MLLDLTKLSEDELIELNRHIVERLRLLRSTKSLARRVSPSLLRTATAHATKSESPRVVALTRRPDKSTSRGKVPPEGRRLAGISDCRLL